MGEIVGAGWDFVRNLFRGRYVALLEEEVARERAENDRLRAENRALVNSLLGTAGFPPLDLPLAKPLSEVVRARRRSWPQIAALREAEAARKAEAAKSQRH